MSVETTEKLENVKDDVCRHLEHLSTGFQQCYNEDSFENHWIKNWLSVDFKAYYDDEKDLDVTASFNYRRRLKAANPQMVMNILEMDSFVDERRKEGIVWQNIELTGQPPGTARRAFVVLEWEMRLEKWWCCRLTAMASMPGIGGDRSVF